MFFALSNVMLLMAHNKNLLGIARSRQDEVDDVPQSDMDVRSMMKRWADGRLYLAPDKDGTVKSERSSQKQQHREEGSSVTNIDAGANEDASELNRIGNTVIQTHRGETTEEQHHNDNQELPEEPTENIESDLHGSASKSSLAGSTALAANSLSSCWSRRAFGGDAWDYNHSSTWELAPSQCNATATHWGGSGMDVQRASEQLHSCSNGRGLVVLVVGGSITTGHCQNRDPRILAGYEKSWPAQLETHLNAEHPCGGNNAGSNDTSSVRHTVINRSERSVGSNHWMEYFLSARSDPDHAVHRADVVLLETASNDYQSWHGAAAREVTKYVELIVRILRRLPHRPVVMWVTVGWRPGGRDSGGNLDYVKALSSEPQHLEVMKYYDVPHVSMLRAMEPLDERREFLNRYYFADIRSHLTILGHQLTGGVVGSRLARQFSLDGARRSGAGSVQSLRNYTLPPALGREEEEGNGDEHWLKMLDIVDMKETRSGDSNVTKIDFRDPNHLVRTSDGSVITTKDLIVFNRGWEFREDVPGKPGLIADQVGSKITVFLPQVHELMFSLGIMKSYERMGLADVSFIYSRQNVACSNGTAAVLGTDGKENGQLERMGAKIVDGHWESRASMKDLENLMMPESFKTLGIECAWMEITVRNGRRAENKVKLLDLTVY